MSQAIQVKYLSPTTTKGSRLRAFCQAGSIIVDWRHDLSAETNYMRAAMEIVLKFKWNCTLHCGQLKNGDWVYTLGHL